MTATDFASVVTALSDEFAIRQLTARYNEAWDTGQVDAWLDTFVADGEFVMQGVPQTKGQAALRRMIEAMLPANLIHLTVDHRITVSTDSAQQLARVILGLHDPSRAPGTSQWLCAGSYVDELRRGTDGWRFVSRAFAPDAALSGLPKWW